ncbi:hypothetical protein Q4E93_20760 [Flavitalea sp. BT771]|uniref:hypothetical protein n=1 Tax=Flavitalea sp. BT771 TaxID=3063329 RepID=UPI0026E43ACE|nr:hypothetical protein [Flavitalea sp. BT771]MDO6433052.1 hypothetical protein [Flavitalea sp. BT771]MDV6221672.1 hypothetical protein [Flavitalea sp. BT771]
MTRRKRKKVITYRLEVAVSKEDLERVKKRLANSTCRNLTELVRKSVLGKPVITFTRSKSFDEFIEEAIALRKEMQTVRQTLPFTPEGEMRLIAIQAEIKTCINKIFDHVSQNKSN